MGLGTGFTLMRGFVCMRLTKTGILSDELPDGEAGAVADRPQDSMALLAYWHGTLEGIGEDYTFGDLVVLLRGVEEVERLSSLLGCDVAALLAEADRPRSVDHEAPLQYVQVRNVAVLTTYQEDPSRPDEPLQWMNEAEAAEQDRLDSGVAEVTGEPKARKLVDATGDDPLTGEPIQRRVRPGGRRGAWKPPHHVRREFDGWGRQSEPYDGYFRQHPEVDPEHYERTDAPGTAPAGDSERRGSDQATGSPAAHPSLRPADAHV